MAAYTSDQQAFDKQVINATIANLGAKMIGEKQQFFDNHLQDYIRIARLWAHPKLGDARTQLECYRMFLDLAESQQISAFMLEPYERLLKATRKLIQSLVFRRKRKADDTCAEPENHIQTCHCRAMRAAMAAKDAA